MTITTAEAIEALQASKQFAVNVEYSQPPSLNSQQSDLRS